MSHPTPQSQSGAIAPKSAVRDMFQQIVPRYDLMNHVMTFGMDFRWRALVASIAANRAVRPARTALDVACGTGDIAFAMRRAGIPQVTGLDYTPGMIERARQRALHDPAGPTFMVGDAMQMPFADNRFDAVAISFGLRNLPDYQAAVQEMARVCAPGGKVICLEMTPFRQPILKPLFTLYFEQIVPIIGLVVSGNYRAYKYLPTSTRAFPQADELADMYRAAGLTDVHYTLHGFGAVAMHVGTKF